jgi:hypothetical protein
MRILPVLTAVRAAEPILCRQLIHAETVVRQSVAAHAEAIEMLLHVRNVLLPAASIHHEVDFIIRHLCVTIADMTATGSFFHD